jgi:hypothetical protein
MGTNQTTKAYTPAWTEVVPLLRSTRMKKVLLIVAARVLGKTVRMRVIQNMFLQMSKALMNPVAVN